MKLLSVTVCKMNMYEVSIASWYNFLLSFEHGSMGKKLQFLIYKKEKPMWIGERRRYVTHILKVNTFSWPLSKGKQLSTFQKWIPTSEYRQLLCQIWDVENESSVYLQKDLPVGSVIKIILLHFPWDLREGISKGLQKNEKVTSSQHTQCSCT